MILKKQEGLFYDPSIIIPATFNSESGLSFENNGVSKLFFSSSPKEFAEYSTEAFQLFAMCPMPVERPFFIAYEGKQPLRVEISANEMLSDSEEEYPFLSMWEMFYVYSKRRTEPDGTLKKKSLQYTCIRQCRPDTYFCRCDDCGEYFVVTPQTVKYYLDRGLVIPTIRCPKCVQKKRVRYNCVSS